METESTSRKLLLVIPTALPLSQLSVGIPTCDGESKDEFPQCSDYREDLTNKNSPRTHQKQLVEGSTLNIPERFNAVEKSHRCCLCEESFSLKSDLLKHEKSHFGERPYTCDVCGKDFYAVYVLRAHMRVHTGEQSFSCNECGKKFSRIDNLNQHKKLHTGEKPFTCNECGKKFSRIYNLNQHKKLHTGEKPFTCNECGKNFSRGSNLNKHKKLHKGKTQHSCSDSAKSFLSNSELYWHMRDTHMPQDPPRHEFLKCSDEDNNVSQHWRTHEEEESVFVANGLTSGVLKTDSLQENEAKSFSAIKKLVQMNLQKTYQ